MIHDAFVRTVIAVAWLATPILAPSAFGGGALHGDSSPGDPPAELELSALVDEVLERNPSLGAMRAAADAAATRVAPATALDDPRLSYGIAPATIGERNLDLGQTFELSQRIPWPGKLAARGHAAGLEADAVLEDLAATRLRLTAIARETFYDWWSVHRALEVQSTLLALLGELRGVAEARYGAGLASKRDALQAELERERARHRDVVLRREREVTRARLNALVDRPPRDPIPPPPSRLDAPSPLPSPELLERHAIESRPALEAERRRIEARRAGVRTAELDFLPDLTLTGAYSSLWEVDELRPVVSIAIDLPIRLAPRRAALGQARAELRRAEARLARQASEVRLEVARAFEELREHAHVVRLYDESIRPAAEENLSAARSGYEAGTDDFDALIQAQKDLLDVELTEHAALAAYHRARARLEEAVGLSLDRLEPRP